MSSVDAFERRGQFVLASGGRICSAMGNRIWVSSWMCWCCIAAYSFTVAMIVARAVSSPPASAAPSRADPHLWASPARAPAASARPRWFVQQAMRHHRREQRFLLAVVAAIGEIQIEIGDFQKNSGRTLWPCSRRCTAASSTFSSRLISWCSSFSISVAFTVATSHEQVGSRQGGMLAMRQSRHASRCQLVGSA